MTLRYLRLAGILFFAASFLNAVVSVHDARAQPQSPSYAQDLVPIFRGYCVSCHQPGGQGYEASGVDLRTYEGLMKGTKYGRVVIPGQPDASSLIALVEGRTAPQIRMPFDHHPLPSCLQEEIWTWIFQGAKDN